MKVLRYAVIASTAGAVDFLIFVVFARWLGFNYLIVGAAGFIIGTLLNYWMCVRFLFQSGVRFGPRHEVVVIFVVALVGLSINLGVLYLGIGLLGMDMLIIKLGANCASFGWNYAMRRWFVFAPAR